MYRFEATCNKSKINVQNHDFLNLVPVRQTFIEIQFVCFIFKPLFLVTIVTNKENRL